MAERLGSSVRGHGEGPSNMLYLGRFHFLSEKKEGIFVFLCWFFFFFYFSDRSEIRSCQIGPVERKEAEASTKRFPGQITQEEPRETLPLQRREQGLHVGLTPHFLRGSCFRLLIFPNEVLFIVIILLFVCG